MGLIQCMFLWRLGMVRAFEDMPAFWCLFETLLLYYLRSAGNELVIFEFSNRRQNCYLLGRQKYHRGERIISFLFVGVIHSIVRCLVCATYNRIKYSTFLSIRNINACVHKKRDQDPAGRMSHLGH
jgi:hypothetical protein